MTVAAVAVIATVSCAKVSDQTAIKGSFETKVPVKVNISVPGANFDTTVAVTKGKFSVKVPACKTALSEITYDNAIVHFVSDGTPLTMKFKDDMSYEIKSRFPKISVQKKYTDYTNAIKDLQTAAKAKIDSLKDKTGPEAEALMNKYYNQADSINEKALAENKDNIITVKILNTLQYDLPDNAMDSILNTVDTSLYSVPSVAAIRDILNVRKETAEGKMFKDFDVNGVKLSDYVGKGKYMLVDFWASWCGPCKGEIPNVKKVYEKYAGDNFDVLSVAVWDKQQASVDTAKAYGISWNQITGDDLKTPTDAYGIAGIPHIILFGPDGTILNRDLRGDAIETEVAKHVQPVQPKK